MSRKLGNARAAFAFGPAVGAGLRDRFGHQIAVYRAAGLSQYPQVVFVSIHRGGPERDRGAQIAPGAGNTLGGEISHIAVHIGDIDGDLAGLSAAKAFQSIVKEEVL